MLIRPGQIGRVGSTKRFAASVASAFDIILVRSDSIGNGVFTREAGDTDWPSVFQWRTRAPAGIGADTTPIDSGTAANLQAVPDGLSPIEYMAKAHQQRTGRATLIMLNGYNGSQYSSGWAVGGIYHEEFITKANAAIAGSGGTVVAIVEILGTNDANSSVAKATFKTAKVAAMANVRSRVAGAASVRYIHVGLLPEFIPSDLAVRRGIQEAIQEVVAENANTAFVGIREGYNGGDFTHPSNAGNRLLGADLDAILADVTAPTITTSATFGAADGSPINIVLTGNEYATWVWGGSDAALFEKVRTYGTGGTGGINTTRATDTLQLIGNASASYATKASYSLTLTAMDAARNVSAPKAITVTVAQPYGVGDQGPVSATYAGAASPSSNIQFAPTVAAFPLKAGLNLLYFWHDGGGVIQSIAANGVSGARFVPSTDASHGDVWGLIAAADGNYDLTVNTNGQMNNTAILNVALKGTKATPLTTNFVAPVGGGAPVESPSLTCPANGIIVGMGLLVGATGPTAGNTSLAIYASQFFANFRTTTGSMGETGGGGYKQLSTLVFEKSV